jgi:hypothetical protein
MKEKRPEIRSPNFRIAKSLEFHEVARTRFGKISGPQKLS